MKLSGAIAFFYLIVSSILYGQSSGLLPIYSNPMIFIDSMGNVVGKLPVDFKILNTPEGKHSPGWAQGMAPNTVAKEGLVPAINYETGDITLFDKSGVPKIQLGKRFSTVTPAYNGYHLASYQSDEMFPKPVYNYLNKNGERTFSPTGYRDATPFHDGYAAVRKDNSWMYINELGQELKIIDASLNPISGVSSFYDGLSRIKLGWGFKCGFETCYDYIFIDKSGAIVLDTRKIFPNKRIKNVSDMHDDLSLVVFFTDSTRLVDNEIAYLHKSGKVIGLIDNAYRKKEFNSGYAPIVTTRRNKNGSIENDSVFLLKANGDKIFFETKEGFQPNEVFHVGDHFYIVSFWNYPEKRGMQKVYDVRTHKFLYETRETIMGVKWDLVSLRNPLTNRYYVVNFRTGEIVYDTDVSDRIYNNMSEALPHMEKVMVFECDDATELPKLNLLEGLKELTIRNLKIESLPSNLNFSKLEILRIDGLNDLIRLPSQIKGLKKISLRDGVKVVNLMEMLEGQNELKELYVINFGLSRDEEIKIEKMFPDAKILIQGTKESASSFLQEVIEGF